MDDPVNIQFTSGTTGKYKPKHQFHVKIKQTQYQFLMILI